MAWMITAAILLTEVIGALCFNINPVAWKILEKDAAGFGHQVVQRSRDLLVSAPLEQHQSTERGQIFRCTTTDCNPLPLTTPDFAVNMSLGLMMTSDPGTQNTLVCGPTIPKDCETITMYDGLCLEIDTNNAVLGSMPSTGKECQNQADITFLMDGSGSVRSSEFSEMKNFVMDICTALPRRLVQFAIVQFSASFTVHNYLTTIDPTTLQEEMRKIKQLGSVTFTATAIRGVVEEVFIESRGSRKNVKKILIVITDGRSNDPPGQTLTDAVRLAQSKKIVRFAIGVGSAFSSRDAINELKTIASSPSSDHVFQVQSFTALQKIRQTLQDKIFSIEGSKTSGETVKREMSQGGFSAAYSREGIKMGIVGANQWRGGFDRYTAGYQFMNSYEPSFITSDSYLGYSMAVAKTTRGSLTIIGAPRYKHRGAVMAVQETNVNQIIDPYPWQYQSGEYFGAEVCAMNLDADSNTDLVLISAPMYNEDDREGRVYVCHLSGLSLDCHLDSPLLLRGAASNKGRFGSSLAVLPDLHRDNFNDLAVGAPLENDGTGSIYIFHGEGGIRGINPDFSQRITGSEVQSGLKFFGTSISKSSFDQSGDKLPDLAVGSKGKVVLLRSKPIVMVEAGVTYSPKQIPTQDATSDCSVPLRNRVRICFTMTTFSGVARAQARINYTLTLDATRKIPNNRAYISDKVQEETRSVNLDLKRQLCQDIVFSVKACPEDALNELRNELTFTFEGVPDGGLSPSLSLQAQTSAFYPLGFEINCGNDGNCVDNLKVDIGFGKSSVVRVGIDELLDVTVTVTNRGEDSYNTRVILTYPAGLSYRKIVPQQGRIECNSLDSETGLSRGTTDCTINQPSLRSGATAVVIISYGIDSNSQLNNNIFFTANAASGNQDHSASSEPYARKDIDVKYSIFATMQSSLSYTNFSYGKNDLQKPVQQTILVANDVRALNFTVVIKVPVMLGGKDIWVDSSSFQIPECRREKDEDPKVTDFVQQIKKMKIVDCSVAKCGVFKCRTFMVGLEKKKYQISANLSSEWIEQIGLESAKFILTSTATLDYDRDQYIFISAGVNNNPPISKIKAEVEVYSEPDFTKEIVGGSVGGLVLLALITAGLYKAGFFKSKYKKMMSAEAGEGGSPGGDEGAPPPEKL